MSTKRVLFLFPLLLCACSTTPRSLLAVNTLFCDRYFIYPMCAQDVTGNGQTDFVYFEDSNEVFLFNNRQVHLVPNNLTLHKCAQRMDEPLIDATSLLLTVDDDMSLFRRTEIKNGIFFHYMRYIPRVSGCSDQTVEINEEVEDDFGVAENVDYSF